jgi:hypothetical protein
VFRSIILTYLKNCLAEPINFNGLKQCKVWVLERWINVLTSSRSRAVLLYGRTCLQDLLFMFQKLCSDFVCSGRSQEEKLWTSSLALWRRSTGTKYYISSTGCIKKVIQLWHVIVHYILCYAFTFSIPANTYQITLRIKICFCFALREQFRLVENGLNAWIRLICRFLQNL